jgi:hypothetical protein
LYLPSRQMEPSYHLLWFSKVHTNFFVNRLISYYFFLFLVPAECSSFFTFDRYAWSHNR